ncbi:TetR/AcrR family transcriptional regulator [Brevibacillus sp. DP1.3A]|uniref:TetR/AcrR family transcriptional regulator n=1 Tax=Brevibacillus sp. DP1.3A TaxID=2738867 RepID=UPI00156AD0E4|nr:TetR/AcrR family transcriptional regulator [Brevibacillus sp. DP1.3A]UED75241.1 TetR/AcrR family transcriptional regulator [Brevibacillus sp. DP1.3A]
MSRNKSFEIPKVLDLAIDVFWHKGYVGCSMQDLVEQLGLSRSSIYETFGSKEDLYLQALERYDRQSKQILAAILYEQGPAKELLLRYFHEVIEYTRRRSCFMVNASLELAASHPEVFKRVQANMAENEEAFYQLLERAVQTGELKGTWNLKALAQYLVNVMHGITVTTVTAEREMLDNIVRSSLYFLP